MQRTNQPTWKNGYSFGEPLPEQVVRPAAYEAATPTHTSSGAAVVAGFLTYLAVMPLAMVGALVLLAFGL